MKVQLVIFLCLVMCGTLISGDNNQQTSVTQSGYNTGSGGLDQDATVQNTGSDSSSQDNSYSQSDTC